MRWKWSGLALLLGVALPWSGACGGDGEAETASDDEGGSGASTSATTSGGGESPTTSVTGGSGGVGGAAAGGQGGVGAGPIAWAEPPVHLEEQCIGSVPTGLLHTFNVPANTFGFTLTGSVPNPNALVGLNRLRPGSAGSVIVDFDITGKDFDPFVDLGIVAGANPQSDLAEAWPMFVGDWRVIFADDGSAGSAEVCVYARRSIDGLAHGGVMDVNVRIAPGAGVSTSYMEGVLQQLFEGFFEPGVGIAQGTVTFGVLPASFDGIDDGEELQTLFRSSAGIGSRPAVNLFVVGDFTGGEFGNAIGVAGGIPGTPMVHGTAQSGVAYQPSGDAAFDAGVLAHEIGHLGGLWHTTELAIDVTDPLSDTPECPNIGANPNGCPDVGNVMFPIAYSGTTLSEGQARVLAGSTLYRGRTEAGGAPGGPLPGGSAAAWKSAAVALEQTLVPTTRRPTTDDAERLLSAVWCAHGGVDHLGLVAELVPAARLLALAADPGAFDLARGRALAALAASLTTLAERAVLASVALDILAQPGSGRAALLAAIELLAADDEGALAVLVATLGPRHLAKRDRLVVRRLAALGL